MKFQRHIEIEKGKLDLTPLVDVVLLLLIFFMLTSSFISQPSIPVKLPKALTGESLQKLRFEIFVTEEDIIYVEGKPITIKDLKIELNKIKQAKDIKGILIKSDRNASLGKVVRIWDLCREIGISQVDLATNVYLEN